MNGVFLRSSKTASLTFHLPIADGSLSSTLRYSPAKKYPIIELPLVPSVFLAFTIGPESENPTIL